MGVGGTRSVEWSEVEARLEDGIGDADQDQGGG